MLQNNEEWKQETLKMIYDQIIEEKKENTAIKFLDPKFSKIAKSYMSIHTDLTLVLNAIDKLISNKKIENTDDTITNKALWIFIIITYAKCFTKASSTKLESKECFKEDKQDFYTSHNEIMRLRHEFVAHRGDTEFEQSIVYIEADKLEPNKIEYKIKYLSASSNSIEVLNRYKTLIAYILKFSHDKMTENLMKLNKNLNEGTPEEIRKKFIQYNF